MTNTLDCLCNVTLIGLITVAGYEALSASGALFDQTDRNALAVSQHNVDIESAYAYFFPDATNLTPWGIPDWTPITNSVSISNLVVRIVGTNVEPYSAIEQP